MAACSICQHPARAAMIEALMEASLRQVAQQYHVSKSALIRHRQRCGPPQVDQVDQGDYTPQPLARFHVEIMQLQAAVQQMKYTDDWRLMLRGVLDLLARMTASNGTVP